MGAGGWDLTFLISIEGADSSRGRFDFQISISRENEPPQTVTKTEGWLVHGAMSAQPVPLRSTIIFRHLNP